MTTTPMRRIDEIRDESRRRILDAAEELFAEKGFDKTSFDDIASRSGISRGSIPRHFTNKDGLLLAVVNRANKRRLSPEQLGDNASLDTVLSRYGELAKEHGGGLLFAVLTEALTSEGKIHEEYKAHHAEQRKNIEVWLREMGLRPARKREALAATIMGSIIGIHLQWQLDPETVDIDAAFHMVAALVDTYLDA